MAANRFATMIHRKTNRITLVLVYAFLEWTLIFFILLNSLFSYFILRFADYFGLKRPCLFCSRLDRFFDASGKSPSHKDLLCDDHALEISRVHSKPVKSKRFVQSRLTSDEYLKGYAGRSVEKTASSCYAQIEPDFGNMGYSHTRNLIDFETQIHNGRLFTELSRSILGSVSLMDSQEISYIKKEETEKKKLPSENEQREEELNTVIEIVPQSPGKIKTVDDETDMEFSSYVSNLDCNREVAIDKKEEKKLDLPMVAEVAQETDDKPAVSAPKNFEFYIDDKDCHLIPVELYTPSEEVREISDVNGDFILDFAAEDGELVSEEISAFPSPIESKPDSVVTSPGSSSTDDDLQQMQNDEETDAEVSIGAEIPDHEQIGDISSPHEPIPDEGDDHGNILNICVTSSTEDDTLEFRTITTKTMRPVLNFNEERLLETQGSMETLHNAMSHIDQRGTGTETLDSVECPEGVLTIDKLKLELQEERKALNSLYEELEEERSASAIAANETMAMINRLQEEKAAMQMEALQNQRMMEEQSEFDQEALQLLNELILNREKENTELEKELEVCRKRLEEYEAKEKMCMLRRRMRDSSVDSYRNNGDSDENSGELHNKNVEGISDSKIRENDMENTPVDIVLGLDECLDDYEGERLSILGRLKFLEEKLTALNDEEDKEEEVKTFENNGSSINGDGHINGKETNGKHRVIKSKRLLPLFDAVDGEMENGNHQENGIDESENGENVTVEEEVDELYERLEALEADREFLRHCVGSLKKGDKGVHLLHEILQHLRDLKNIDLIHIRENENMSF